MQVSYGPVININELDKLVIAAPSGLYKKSMRVAIRTILAGTVNIWPRPYFRAGCRRPGTHGPPPSGDAECVVGGQQCY